MEKAEEVGSSQAVRDFKLQLKQGKISKSKYQEMIKYLETTLTERKELAARFEKENEVRQARETEYKHKRELLAQLPELM